MSIVYQPFSLIQKIVYIDGKYINGFGKNINDNIKSIKTTKF